MTIKAGFTRKFCISPTHRNSNDTRLAGTVIDGGKKISVIVRYGFYQQYCCVWSYCVSPFNIQTGFQSPAAVCSDVLIHFVD
jgi:hypothetical protein